MEKKEERREVNNVKEKNTNLVSVERSQICAEVMRKQFCTLSSNSLSLN